MSKNIKQTFDEIVAFQQENPEQNRAGCLYAQNAQGQTFRNYTIQNEVFKQCNFNKAFLISCTFIKCSFLECDFTGTEFVNCKFIECTINNSIFVEAILTDTRFTDCTKANNILDHIHCGGGTKGLTAKDQNIMQDEIIDETDNETAMQQDLKTVFTEKISKIMQDNFSKWDKEQNNNSYPSFTYTDESNLIGITLFSDEEKNSTDTDNFWCLSFFFKNDSLYTSDFNFFGLESEDIISIINNWQTEALKDNAAMILQRIIENLK